VKETLCEQFARLGKAVASPRRIELLDLLCQGERTVEGLATASRMSVTNTSAHLRVLRQARLVGHRQEGTRRFYQATPAGLADLKRYLESMWDDVLGAYAQSSEPRS